MKPRARSDRGRSKRIELRRSLRRTKLQSDVSRISIVPVSPSLWVQLQLLPGEVFPEKDPYPYPYAYPFPS